MTERTSFADRLYGALPTVYRERDTDGDLAHYLGACGDLLDALRQTLVQRYADIFPDSPDDDLACQDWILPYLADLLAVRLVSPEPEGRRQEVDNALAWRQRKGTRHVAERIAEAVGQLEVELIEGWQKVAVTARVDAVRLPARSYGVEPSTEDLDALTWKTAAPIAARHPTLVAGTVDLRCRAGAVRVQTLAQGTLDPRYRNGTVPVPAELDNSPLNQAARKTSFPGEPDTWWRQASLHGAPCHPSGFDDPSRRTADARTPRWDQGHAHPRRLLLYVPPPPGLCETTDNTIAWADRGSTDFANLVSVSESADLIDIRPATDAPGPVWITGDIDISGKDATLTGIVVEGLVSIDGGTLTLERAAVEEVEATNGPTGSPIVYARDALLGVLDAADHTVVLEYATVLGDTICAEVLASDSIFVAPIANNGGPAPKGCIRYSRIAPEQNTSLCKTHNNTSRLPIFFSTAFGEWACAVLHPVSPQSIRIGAEDGGEMGAHHHHQLVLRANAVLKKLADFLPLDIIPVLIPDPAMLKAPPELT